MALRNKLLATAAIPLIALTGLAPAYAAPLPQAAIASPQSTDVTPVQSDEELLQQQKEQRRQERQQRQQEKQQKQQQRQQDQDQQQREQRQQERQQRQQENQQRQQEQQQDQQRQQEREQRRQERQRQQQEDQQRQNDQAESQKEQRRQERKRQQEEQQGQQQDENRKNRAEERKRQNAESEENRVIEEQGKEKPRKRNPQSDDASGQNQNAEQPRKRNNGSVEEIETQRPRDNKAAAEEQRGEPKRLPVKNGAAVLDSEKDADKGDESARDRRRRERQEQASQPVRAPRSDREAQAGFKDSDGKPIRVRPALEEKGERITGFQGYDLGEGRRVNDRDNRVIIKLGDRVIVRDDDRDRLGRRGDTRYDRLANDRVREVVVRPDGTRIVTIRNRYGEIIKRTRIEKAGREVVIFYSPILDAGRADRLYLRDPGARLPPMRLSIPVEDYIIDVSREPNRNYVEFLEEPPVEPVERVYSVDEVKYSARIRDKVRRIDLDTITFETGSWDISMNQASSLKRVGAAIQEILDKDPGETFLIEGHTDAVGSDESNLVLSDRRAESVAEVLSDMFDIPAENLVTQGYGERYLKINTEDAERENRRVTIRRITPLVRPVAQAE